MLLFANIGYQYKIGGKECRGGLIADENDNCLLSISDPKVYDALQKHDPPLFHNEDVQRYFLLHFAVLFHSLDLVKYTCKLDPPNV